ncbi:A49-like RNA polymerase I associated factor-domain-containing protein, partial [Baffinella frigidus]
ASSLTKDQSRDQLVSAFGSKRVKKTHQERKGVQLQQDSEDTIADIHETLTVKKEEADAAKVQMGVVEAGVEAPNELAPLPNLEATAVNEVYTLAGLLSDEQWDAISDKLLIKIAADEEASKMLPSFCRANVGAVIAAADKKAKKVQARLLSYVAFLIFFHNISSRFKKDAQALLIFVHKISSRFKKDAQVLVDELGIPLPIVLADELGIPLPIGTHFLKEFAVRDGNSYTKPQAQRDRLLLHLTTAALIFSNYDMHLDMLAADVKIHPDRVGAYFKELGAKVSKGTTQRKSVSSDEQATAAAQPIYKVTLTLPLVFPKRSRGGPK